MMGFPRMLAVGVLCALGASTAVHAQQAQRSFPGTSSADVYVMSNNIQSNSIAVLKPNFFGGLDKVAVVATGGVGVGVGTTNPVPDPLGSQNALFKSRDGRWLFAANAGSNQISVFAIEGDRLDLVDVVNSGGSYPVSVAQNGDRVYVLNVAGAANIAVFDLAPNGSLIPVSSGSRLIGTDEPLVGNQPNVAMTPAQIELSPDGKWLAVSVKDVSARGSYELFAVDHEGDLAQDPVITSSSDPEPFGFDFDSRGLLISSDAVGSAASSYSVGLNGVLNAISSQVANGQAAACWLAISGNYAFTSNAGTGTISAYEIRGNGTLALVGDGVAATLISGAAATDLKVSPDGHILYVNDSVNGDVYAFLILPGGKLFKVSETSVFPGASGMQGLAL
jgi:6-phosphogluconolactonase